MELRHFGSLTFTAEVGQPIELVTRVTDGAQTVEDVEVAFECLAGQGLFRFGQGTSQEGVVCTQPDGYARCQIIPQEAARGRMLQIRATVTGGELDDDGNPTGRTVMQHVHFNITVPQGEPECVAEAGEVVVLQQQQQQQHCCHGHHHRPPRVRFMRC